MKAKYKIVELVYKLIGLKGIFLLHCWQHRRGIEAWRNEDAVFIHVPKTAGTSINKFFGLEDIGHIPYRKLNFWFSGSFNREKKYFVVYRDPMDRLVSTYRYARNKTRLSVPSVLSWIDGCEDFKSFVNRVYRKNYYNDHYFFWPTSTFIEGIDGELAILPFEMLESKLREYLELNESEFSFPHANHSPSEMGKILIDKDTKDLVKKMYKDDYRIGDHIKEKNYAIIYV